MFGLAEQVHGHPVRRRRAVGQHQDLARTGNHVDAHRAEHPALGRRHIGIARAGDLVHLGHRRRAVGQRRHRLRATDREHPRHAGHMGGGQHQRIALALSGGAALAGRRRHHHDDFRHAGHMGRNRVHQHRRRIGGLAAGHIDADPVQRRDLLAQQAAIGVAVAPALATGLLLCLVVAAHAVCGKQQGLALFVRQAVEGLLECAAAQSPARPRTAPRHRRNAPYIPAPPHRRAPAHRPGCRPRAARLRHRQRSTRTAAAGTPRRSPRPSVRSRSGRASTLMARLPPVADRRREGVDDAAHRHRLELECGLVDDQP